MGMRHQPTGCGGMRQHVDTVTHGMNANDWAHGNPGVKRDRLMTTKDLAEYLQCSRRHIERMRKVGMPDMKVGGLLRFCEKDVLAWLEYERRGRRLFQISDEEMDDYRRLGGAK
jgi:excisionase family DNA binding protein